MKKLKLFVNGQTKEATLEDYLVYRNHAPESEAKNFDEYTETGIYAWVDSTLTECENRPTDEYGTLTVKNTKGGVITHRYVSDSNVIYLRSRVNEVWTAWAIEVDKEYVDERTTLHAKEYVSDGVTQTYALNSTINARLYINGIRQPQTAFTVLDKSVIKLKKAPIKGARLLFEFSGLEV